MFSVTAGDRTIGTPFFNVNSDIAISFPFFNVNSDISKDFKKMTLFEFGKDDNHRVPEYQRYLMNYILTEKFPAYI